MHFDDISFLVSETFDNVENGHFSYSEKPKIIVPEAPGVFYHIQQSAGIFVLRIQASDNLLEDYNKIVNNPEDYPSLRLVSDEGESNIEELKFFECDRVELARALKMQLSNRRFPIYEENVINVSDPSYSWWLDDSQDEFKIYFKLSNTLNMRRLKKIGPLYDSKLAMERFAKLYGYFSMLFPVGDFSSNHGQMSISCNETLHPLFLAFKDLFIEGEIEYELWEKLRDLELEASHNKAPYLRALQEANYFLMELATIRKFWKAATSELKEF